MRRNSGKQGDLYSNLFYWNSLLARLNSHYETWSYKKKKYKMHTGNSIRKNLQVKMSVKCLIESYLDHSLYKPWFSLNLMYLCLCSVCFFCLFTKNSCILWVWLLSISVERRNYKSVFNVFMEVFIYRGSSRMLGQCLIYKKKSIYWNYFFKKHIRIVTFV